jgi:hypothetical protein
MSNRRYAARTKVNESKSRAEIEGELLKHKCDRIAVMTAASAVDFAWTKSGRAYRMGITLPSDNAQERRRRMRTLALYIRGRLNAVEDGIKSFEAEFMPEVVLGDGRTLGEHAHVQLAELEADEALPTRLQLPQGRA